MGKPGQKPKPAALRAETGNRSKEENQARIDAEPSYAKQEFKTPASLCAVGKAKWQEIRTILRDMKNCPVSDADADVLEIACRAWAEMKTAQKEIEKNPAPIINLDTGNIDRNGNKKYATFKNPYYDKRDKAAALYVKCCNQLCLDVESRARIGKIGETRKKEDNILDVLQGWEDK